MKKIIFLLCAVIITIPFIYSTAHSQSIFLKNGSIIEGKIIEETDLAITINSGDGNISIPRKSIIRIVYDGEYKHRVSIILMDGRTIVGYVVEEGKNFYIVRKQLISTRELKINKKKVNGILKKSDIIVKDTAKDEPVQDESSEFPGLDVRTLKRVYKPFEEIQVKFKNTPGGRYDWISLAKMDSPDDQYEAYYYVNNKTEGDLKFKNGLPVGKYEVRVYLHWAKGSYKVSKRYSFSVNE